MHTKSWQSVCGFLVDACESIEETAMTMRDLFYAITAQKGVLMSWMDGKHVLQLSAEDFRKKVLSIAHSLKDLKGDMIGLHLSNRPTWPAFYWAILMSGHKPLIMDSRYELFHYRELPDTEGIPCITEDQQYPQIISPDHLLSDHFTADAALYENLWADETVFAVSGNDHKPIGSVFTGRSLCGQILRLRYLYRSGTRIVYPPNEGRLHVAVNNSFAEISGFLPAIIWYPYLGKELNFVSSTTTDDLFHSIKVLKTTHLFASSDFFDTLAADLCKFIIRNEPKVSNQYIAWLKGKSMINNYTVLSRYVSLGLKIRKSLTGKRLQCMISINGAPKEETCRILNHIGFTFTKGYCDPVYGAVALDRSDLCDERSDDSVGQFLSGVQGEIDSDGNLVLDGEYHASRYLGIDTSPASFSPFHSDQKAMVTVNGKLKLLQTSCQDARPHDTDPAIITHIQSLYALTLGIPPDRILPDMHFFIDLGGDSLSYFMLLQHIEVDYGIYLLPQERMYLTTPRHAAETLMKYQRKKEEQNEKIEGI